MYRIGLIQTDNFTVNVGTMESMGPIMLKIRKINVDIVLLKTKILDNFILKNISVINLLETKICRIANTP